MPVQKSSTRRVGSLVAPKQLAERGGVVKKDTVHRTNRRDQVQIRANVSLNILDQ
jgi:hypothetical protein